MHNCCDIRIAVAAPGKNFRDLLQVCNGIKVSGGLFPPEAAIQVTANGGVPAIPRKLANMVNVISNMSERDPLVVFGAARPARAQHPIIKRNADHARARDNGVDLFIVKLTLVRNQRAAITVAGKYKTIK